MLTVVCFSQWIEFIREGQTGKMAQHLLDIEKTHGLFQTLGTILTPPLSMAWLKILMILPKVVATEMEKR